MNTKADVNLREIYQEEINIIQQIMLDPITAIPFLGNIIAIIKPDCYEKGIREFPTICLIGQQQTGKTYLARALNIMNNDEPEIMVSSTRNAVIQKKCEQNKGYYLLLDDFANFSSQDTRRNAYSLLDIVVRSSYCCHTAQLIMTAQPEILKVDDASLLSRIIFLKMDGWKDDLKKRILDNVYEHHEGLKTLLIEFSKWFQEQSIDYKHLRKKLENTIPRASHSPWQSTDKITDRAISNLFMIDLARKMLSKFWDSMLKTPLNSKLLIEYYEELLLNMSKEPLTDIELMRQFLLQIFKDKDFQLVRPKLKLLSKNSSTGQLEYKDAPLSIKNLSPDNKNYCYDPLDLTCFPTIYICDPKYLPGFLKHMDFYGSILITPVESFSKKVNNMLNSFCLDNNLIKEEWTIKHITELLNKLDVLLYQKRTNHPTYQFQDYPYDDAVLKRQPVYIFTPYTLLAFFLSRKQELPIQHSTICRTYELEKSLEKIWTSCRCHCGKSAKSFY